MPLHQQLSMSFVSNAIRECDSNSSCAYDYHCLQQLSLSPTFQRTVHIIIIIAQLIVPYLTAHANLQLYRLLYHYA